MPTGYFEAERSEAEAPSEEAPDYPLLIEEIRGASREDAQERMPYWIERFQLGWSNGSDQWAALVGLLPRPDDLEPSISQFRRLLLSATRDAAASDLFLVNPVVAPKLSSYAWTEFLGSHAAGFVAGCLNLARAAVRSASSTSTVMGTLSNAVANYSLTLIGASLHDPALVIPTEDGCSLADALDIPRERFARWSFEKSEQDLQGLLAAFELDKILDVVRSLLGETQLSDAVLTPFLKAALDGRSEPKVAAFMGAFAFESPELSATLRDQYSKETGPAREETLALWARYLARPDAFGFAWECVRPPVADFAPPLGERLEERLKRFEALLRIPRTPGELAPPDPSRDWHWRAPVLRAMAAIGGLVTRKWSDREDRMVAEDDAVAALSSSSEMLATTVCGVLDHCQPYWDVLDPIILRLPADLSVPVLTDYADRTSVWLDTRHHAARLLAQIKGEAVIGGGEDAPPPAEALPQPARQRAALASQTWLSDGAVERLWHVALEVAQSRFDEALAKRYSDERDELSALLADGMARALNGTNSALKMWLRWNGTPPASIQATARRLPPKTKRAAGTLQADLAFLIRCKVGGKCVAKRVTMLKVKKLGAAGPSGWPNDFKLNGTERTQLTRLLTLSPSTHYLFILPRELGEGVRVLPGPLVRDVLATQRIGGGVPVRTVLEAGVRLPEFMLFHVLGLWTGDDDKDLVAKAEDETDADQCPNVVLDLTVSKD